ncbi:polysaccharide biosynthesis C-terminal domain-containing protein [Tepidicaulis sp.]|uniref:polysaccharide biosynthesis C-terminal domain-containing protein n=1 Tax=Tepidicaulis sp. TaxID=1920809 RepID=UPI003B5AF2DB
MIKSTFLAALENAVLLLGKAAALFLFAWLVGPAAQGAFTLFLSAFALITTVSIFGLDTSNNFFGAKALSGRRRAALFGNSLLLALPFSAICVTLMLGLRFFTNILGELSDTLFILLLIDAPLGLLFLATGSLLYGANRFGVRLAGTAFHMLVFLAGLGIEAGSGTLSAEAGMFWWSIGLGLTTLFWLVICWYDSEGLPFAHIPTFKRQMRYALRSYPYFMMSVANFRLDNFIVAGLLGLPALGIYSVAVAAVEVFLYLPRSLVNATLTHQASSKTPSGAKVIRPLLGVLIAILPIALLAPPAGVLILFSSEFTPAATTTVLLLPGIYAMALGAVGSFYLFARARTALASKAAALGAVATLLSNFALIPLLGIHGAAIATSLSYGTFCLYVLRAIAREDNVSLLSLIRPDWAVLTYLRARLARSHT